MPSRRGTPGNRDFILEAAAGTFFLSEPACRCGVPPPHHTCSLKHPTNAPRWPLGMTSSTIQGRECKNKMRCIRGSKTVRTSGKGQDPPQQDLASGPCCSFKLHSIRDLKKPPNPAPSPARPNGSERFVSESKIHHSPWKHTSLNSTSRLSEMLLRQKEMTEAQAILVQPLFSGDSKQLPPTLGTLPFTGRHGGRRSSPCLPLPPDSPWACHLFSDL